MTNFDFEKTIERIGAEFGKKTWPKSLIEKVYLDCYLNTEKDDLVVDVIKRLWIYANKPPTASQFKKALWDRKRYLRRSVARQDCGICSNTGLIYVSLYTDLERYQYQLQREEPPEWYKKLPAKGKQPVKTKVMRCKCGRNRNTEIKSYAEVVGRKS